MSANGTGMVIADANFCATGSILQIGDDTDPAREVVLVVQDPGVGVVSINFAPALRSDHPLGTPVHQRGVSLPLASLRDGVKVGAAGPPSSFIVNTATGIAIGDVVMIDDPGRRELVVVTNVQPAFFTPMLTATPAVATEGILPFSPISNIGSVTSGIFTSGVLTGNINATEVNVGNILFPFLFGYTISARDQLLFEHAAGTPVRSVQSDYFTGFTGVDTIDFTEPFYPFGESPGPGDLFYFGVPTTFPALIHIDVDLQMASPNVSLQWEFLGAQGWQAFDVDSDATDDFVRSGDILIPAQTYAPGQVNNQNNYWLRVLIATGNYGLPAAYVAVDPADPTQGFTVKTGTANLNPPVIRSLTLGL